MGIISTLSIESAHALPMSEAGAGINWDTFSVKWNGKKVYWPTEFSSDSHATGSIASSGFSYYLHQNLNTDAGTAQASSEAWVWLARTDIDNIYSEDLFAISNDITGDYGKFGTLTVSLFFQQGNTGELSVGVWNETTSANPVPEPATIILLGCGLVSIAGLGKWRLAAHQGRPS